MAASPVVHVIDDDASVRHSLVFLLSAAGYAVRAHPSAIAFLEDLDTVQPGCVVSDVRMPGMTGIELLRRLRALGMDLPVVTVTGHGDVPLAVEAMKAGAVDFIEKPFLEDALLRVIETALQSQTERNALAVDAHRAWAALASLSRREREVLDGLMKGHPNKTIAYDLGISARTVEVHRAHVMSKLGAKNLPDLVRRVLATYPAVRDTR